MAFIGAGGLDCNTPFWGAQSDHNTIAQNTWGFLPSRQTPPLVLEATGQVTCPIFPVTRPNRFPGGEGGGSRHRGTQMISGPSLWSPPLSPVPSLSIWLHGDTRQGVGFLPQRQTSGVTLSTNSDRNTCCPWDSLESLPLTADSLHTPLTPNTPRAAGCREANGEGIIPPTANSRASARGIRCFATKLKLVSAPL